MCIPSRLTLQRWVSRCVRGTPHQAMRVRPTVGWEYCGRTETPKAGDSTYILCTLRAIIKSLHHRVAFSRVFTPPAPLPLLVELCKNLLFTLAILNKIKLSRCLFSCSIFFLQEGDSVNVNVTGPGATLALGLMFMKTNNSYVLNQ